jgi:nucleotide-binding universal stress UspA family protein
VIRQRGILRDFPERTETDLYLWILGRRAELEHLLGWEVEADAAAAELAFQFSAKPRRVVERVGGKLRDAVTPDELEAGPSPGYWREQRVLPRSNDRLFADIMVPLSGEQHAWKALDQALEIARREEARLHGLHVLPSGQELQLEDTSATQAEFDRRCETAGVSGKLAFEVGRVARRICDRAWWTDLVVVSLAHPPASEPMARLSSGFRTLIRRCPRPVLAVPGEVSQMSRALLAYDGSPKAEEALFVASYLAGRWGLHLVVASILENGLVNSQALDHAQSYLESRDVSYVSVQAHGPVSEAILEVANEHESDLILMGGYGHGPVLEVVLGSAVDQILRESRWPVLVCR